MPALVPALALAPLLAGCLEHEETLTVRADGTLAVELVTRGDASDLCTGYAVPLHGPWRPRGDGTRAWVAETAPDTGGPEARARAAELAGVDDVELAVAAEFASAAELPRWFAPEDEPYRSAYLERAATLDVETKGAHTVFAFERVYRARRHAPWDMLERARLRLEPELVEKVEARFTFTDAEWPTVAEALGEAYVEAGQGFVRSAIASVYTEGDAELDPRALWRALQRADASLRSVGSRERLDRLRELVLEVQGTEPAGGGAAAEAELEELLTSFKRDGRRALRAAVAEALDEAGVDPRVQNAVRARLEWAFTSYDHTGDLADERFTVRVRMPGVVVDGDFDELDGEVAVWRFDGDDLKDRDRVLRVVSVL